MALALGLRLPSIKYCAPRSEQPKRCARLSAGLSGQIARTIVPKMHGCSAELFDARTPLDSDSLDMTQPHDATDSTPPRPSHTPRGDARAARSARIVWRSADRAGSNSFQFSLNWKHRNVSGLIAEAMQNVLLLSTKGESHGNCWVGRSLGRFYRCNGIAGHLGRRHRTRRTAGKY